MITKVYVAGASKEIDRAKQAIASLEERSIVVTSSWPKVIGSVGAPNPTDATIEQYTEWALRDLSEVDEANYLLLLLPSKGVETVGAYVELGYSFKGRQQVIVTAGRHRPIFTPALSTIHFESDNEAIDWILAQHRVMVIEEVTGAMQDRQMLRDGRRLDNGS